MTLEYKYLYFNLSPFNIWEDDTPTLVPSTGNLITVPSTGTYSTSITTNQQRPQPTTPRKTIFYFRLTKLAPIPSPSL